MHGKWCVHWYSNWFSVSYSSLYNLYRRRYPYLRNTRWLQSLANEKDSEMLQASRLTNPIPKFISSCKSTRLPISFLLVILCSFHSLSSVCVTPCRKNENYMHSCNWLVLRGVHACHLQDCIENSLHLTECSNWTVAVFVMPYSSTSMATDLTSRD